MPNIGYAEIYYINAAGIKRVKIIDSFEMPDRKKGEDICNYKQRVGEHIKLLFPEASLNTITKIKWRGHSHYHHGYYDE